MKRMIVYISYILSAAVIAASPASFAADSIPATAPAKNTDGAAAAAGGDICADVSADPTGKASSSALNNGKNGADQYKPGAGLKADCSTLQGVEDYLVKAVPIFRANGMENDQFDQIKKGYEEYKKNRQSCLSGHSLASTACAEGASPELAGGAADVNNVLGQMSGGASGNCGGAAKAMDMAKNALTAFTGACGGAKANCSNACDKAAGGAAAVKKQAEAGMASASCRSPGTACDTDVINYRTALQQAIDAGTREASEGEQTSVAGKSQSCNKDMGKTLGSAMQGIMGMLSGMMQGSKCEEETNGTAAEPAPTVDKCTKTENASLPECICLKNPRTIGCSSAVSGQGAAGQMGVGLTDNANVNPEATSTNLGPGDGLGGIQQAELKNDGPGGVGAPQGGGAGVGGSGGGSGGGAPGEASSGKKALNANILGGTAGGGGSSARGMAGSAAADEKYREYLPGGAKDPSKGLAGQDWAKEVTGQGGKSNWDKVRDRYKDNRNSLISN